MPVGVRASPIPPEALAHLDRAAARFGKPYPPRDGGVIFRWISERTGVTEDVLCEEAIRRRYWRSWGRGNALALPVKPPDDPELEELLEDSE